LLLLLLLLLWLAVTEELAERSLSEMRWLERGEDEEEVLSGEVFE
jgi:hypothetical protein